MMGCDFQPVVEREGVAAVNSRRPGTDVSPPVEPECSHTAPTKDAYGMEALAKSMGLFQLLGAGPV